MSKYKYGVYNGKAIKDVIDNSRIFLLSFIVSAGIILGSFVIKSFNPEFTEKTKALIEAYISLRKGQGIAENICNLLVINFSIFAFELFFAMSTIGYPLIVMLIFIKGTAVGAFIGYLYMTYGIMGFGYSVLTILPGTALSLIVLISAGNLSCDFSKKLYLRSIRGIGQIEKGEISVFMIKQLIYILISFAGCAIEAVSTALFGGLFKI